MSTSHTYSVNPRRKWIPSSSVIRGNSLLYFGGGLWLTFPGGEPFHTDLGSGDLFDQSCHVTRILKEDLNWPRYI